MKLIVGAMALVLAGIGSTAQSATSFQYTSSTFFGVDISRTDTSENSIGVTTQIRGSVGLNFLSEALTQSEIDRLTLSRVTVTFTKLGRLTNTLRGDTGFPSDGTMLTDVIATSSLLGQNRTFSEGLRTDCSTVLIPPDVCRKTENSTFTARTFSMTFTGRSDLSVFENQMAVLQETGRVMTILADGESATGRFQSSNTRYVVSYRGSIADLPPPPPPPPAPVPLPAGGMLLLSGLALIGIGRARRSTRGSTLRS